MKPRIDVCDPGAERETAVARKCPGLAGSGNVEGHGAGENMDQEKNAKCIETGSGCGIAEDVEEGIFGRVVEGVVNGCNAEKERDKEDEA